MKKLIIFLISFNFCQGQINSVISQSYANYEIPKIQNSIIAIDTSKSNLDTFLWFNAYESSKYPEVQTSKDYFFIYGTDHDNGAGGIYWAEGDNLDCSDFNELGLIIDGYQAETPFLLRVPEDVDGAVLYLYYHTLATDPENYLAAQETRLIKTNGGLLHDTTWIDEGNPLGLDTQNESHTGYCKVYKHPINGYRAIHLTQAGLSAEYKFSIGLSPLNLTTRDGTYNLNLGIQSGRELKASIGVYFKLYGENWLLGNTEPETSFVGSQDKNLIIARTDSNFQVIETIAVLKENTGSSEALIIGSTAHVYFQDPQNVVKYKAVDLSFLQNYIE